MTPPQPASQREEEIVCIKCGVRKPVSAFYLNRTVPRTDCKECNKAKSRGRKRPPEVRRAWEQANRDKVAAKNRRYRTRHRVAVNARRDRWYAAAPERLAAHVAVRNALRAGTLTRPDACVRCGSVTRWLDAHHADYKKPLDVEWLCRTCHRKADKEHAA